jgi:hypothetical protein
VSKLELKISSLVIATVFAVAGVAGVLLPAGTAEALPPECTYYEGTGWYCPDEEGWCWLFNDGTQECGEWL